MDGQQVRAWEAQCIEEQPPACVTNCPVHVDVRQLAGHVRRGDFSAGLAVLARSIPFPGIIGRICDHPCEGACRRGEAGGAIRINALERACVAWAGQRSPLRPQGQRRKNKKRIAVVGAGLSGLTVAVDLATKDYQVVAFEAQDRPFDRLHAYDPARLPCSVIAADLAAVRGLGIDLRYGCRIGSGGAGTSLAALVEEFDAVYLGVGPAGFPAGAGVVALDPQGRIVVDPTTFATGHPKVFAGGSHRYGGEPYSPITSVQDGRYAALSIDRLCQGASLTANREQQGVFPSRLYTDVRAFAPAPAITPADPLQGYTKDEAIAEATRCFPCHCLECVKACEYLKHYGAYPRRYVREIYNNDSIILGNHKANRMANSCSLCGLCAALCPERLNMGDVCLDARQSMVAKGHMPPSFHDFALRDMEFSNSGRFFLARHQPGAAASAAVFFPGCQLSASSPEGVAHAYAYLQEKVAGGVGLMLGCCGAPARWAGRVEQLDATMRAIVAAWEGLGRPGVIAACPTCQRMLEEKLPDASVTSLWAMLERVGVPASRPLLRAPTFAIHDPCTAREDRVTQDSIRRILAKIGVAAADLDDPGHTTCCGYGGLMSFVNPEVASKVVRRRIEENPADYVTYCAMCRDNFARHGKRAVHVLDLLFGGGGADPAERPDPGFSRRQENRARLRSTLLRTLWREDMPTEEPKLELSLSPAVQAQAEQRLILLDDISAVIAHAERTGEKFIDKASGHCLASFRPVSVTYWVEYARQGAAFVVHRVYSHRMDLSMEPPT